jgi:2-polyprenyl-6-methoxyphenol hydroxylase-like FAD-dependent oxidoreductase
MADTFDVAVVGGGPAGAATSIVLAERGLRVALLEADAGRAEGAGESLSSGATPLLRRLGVWERFLGGHHLAVHLRLSVWGTSEVTEQSSIFDPYGPTWLIDRRAFHELLRARATEAGATVLAAGARACTPTASGWLLELEGAPPQATRAVVDATGRACWLIRTLGGTVDVHDRLVAVIARFEPERGAALPVLVEATREGWWYSAVIPSGELVVVLVGEARVAERWQEALTNAPHTRGRLARARRHGEPARRTIFVQRGVPPPDVACVAVGDAALGTDPLSGSGLRLGLETAYDAADALEGALDGNPGAIASYEASLKRRFDEHLEGRAFYYGLEKRWPDAPFWRLRTARGPAAPAG